MMWEGLNQRRFPRSRLRCDIDIFSDSKSAPLSTFTENVGVGGVCVILRRPLMRFSECGISLEIEKSAAPIRCRGKIVWMVESRDPKTRETSYDTGIEFVDLPDDGRGLIEKHVHARASKVL